MTQAKEIIKLNDIEKIADACENKCEASDSNYSTETQIFYFEDGSRVEQDGLSREFRAYNAQTDLDPASTPVAKFEY